MYINKKIFKEIDYSIIISAILICIVGFMSIASATNVFPAGGSGGSSRNFIMQIVMFAAASIIGCISLLYDYNTIGGYYKIIYILSNLLLVLVLIIGTGDNKGSRSWLGIGSFGVQPSEFAKLATIIALAKVLEEMDNINTWKNLLRIAIWVLIPMGLIQLQPDTGTNLIFAVTIFGMLFVAGLDAKLILGAFGSSAAAFAIIWYSGKLKEYQKFRILVFLKPELDKLGKGYNALIAKTAIGSGMFFGRGPGNGDLTSGNFIPECHTDFIFSVFAEEYGFIGAMVLLALYFNIVFRGYKIALTAKDKFGKYMVVGIITMLTFQVLQNIGMDIGLMPITGIPLPFMSYGGSSMLTNIIAIFLIINVGMRRKKINF